MPSKRPPTAKRSAPSRAPVDIVADTLASYATRGVFRGYGAGPVKAGKAPFQIIWHRDRTFELVFDAKKKELRFLAVLTSVPAASTMYRDLRGFIEERQSDELPEHRRIDANRAHVRVANRGGSVALAIVSHDGDLDYAVRKLIHLVHEVFMVFLVEGSYLEYMIEEFDLDPDRM